MKLFAAAYLICFIITMIVLAAAIVGLMKTEVTQAQEGNVTQQPMKKRDKMLLIPRMILASALVSVPAPLTLAFYAILAIYLLFVPEK